MAQELLPIQVSICRLNEKKMKRFTKPLILFVCSFALGVWIAPTIKVEKEPVSEPTKKPIQHYRNRYGEIIKRTV